MSRLFRYQIAKVQRIIFLLCFLIGFGSSSVHGQSDHQLYQVVLKDSTFYIGIIIEKIPDDHLVMVTLGGNETKIDFENIVRILERQGTPSAEIYVYLDHKKRQRRLENQVRRKEIKEWRRQHWISGARYKGYFALIQYATGYLHWGVSTVHGYKVNQYLNLGLGVGFDGILKPMSFRPSRFSDKQDNARGFHVPVFLHISGDVTRKRATPYYATEIGYAYVAPVQSLLDLETRNISPHGFSVSPSFGVKFNSSLRYHTNLGLKMTYRAREMTFREVILDSESNLYHLEFNKVMTSSWFFGITVVQGF